MIFVDWVTIIQKHLKKCKVLHTDAWIKIDNNGDVIEGKGTLVPFKFEGSHSTGLLVKSDGYRVILTGNIGRLNRPDNVYGYTLDELKKLINQIMAFLELPPFTLVNKFLHVRKNKQGEEITEMKSDGAHFTRLDFTINFATGSAKNATDYIYQASIKNPTRRTLHAYKTGVKLGSETKNKGYKSSKVYIKSADLIRLQKDKSLPQTDYINWLIKYTHDIGVIRFEVQYNSYLRKYGLSFWDTTHAEIQEHFLEELLLMQKEIQKLDILALSKLHQLTYFQYQHGIDMKNELPQSTYYKHRKVLLQYGIDIGQPLNITQFPQQYKTIVLKELEPPEGYYLPPIEQLGNSLGVSNIKDNVRLIHSRIGL